MRKGTVTVFTAREVRTMDPGRPVVDAVAVLDGKVLSTGTIESMAPWLARYDVTVDDSFKDMLISNKVIGEEVTDSAGLTVKLASAELVVTNRTLASKTLGGLVRKHGRGVTVERMARRGDNLPVWDDLPLVAGDSIDLRQRSPAAI